MDCQSKLQNKLQEEYCGYIERLQSLDKAEIIARADIIHTMQTILAYVRETGVDYSTSQYLLSIKSPLEEITEYLNYNCDLDDEIEHALWEISDRELGEPEDYGDEEWDDEI